MRFKALAAVLGGTALVTCGCVLAAFTGPIGIPPSVVLVGAGLVLATEGAR